MESCIDFVLRNGVHELEDGGEHVLYGFGEVSGLGGLCFHHLCLSFDAFGVSLLATGDAVTERLGYSGEGTDELANGLPTIANGLGGAQLHVHLYLQTRHLHLLCLNVL